MLLSISIIPPNNLASAGNWLSGWSYRKSHTINATTGAGTNYQVTVTTFYGAGADSGAKVFLGNTAYSYLYHRIRVPSGIHTDYGLGYPVTYNFTIPAASANLKAYHRHATTESWSQLTANTSVDFFNGIEYVRWDYANDTTYIGVAFSSVSDEIQVRVTESDGTTVTPINFKSIPTYYDDRRMAVVASIDEFTSQAAVNLNMDAAVDMYQLKRVNITASVVTNYGWDEPDYADIQSQLNQGYLEVASHSQTHIPVPYSDYDGEIGDSKTDITSNLTLPAVYTQGASEYVWAWIEPMGQSDAAVRTHLGQYKYLADRTVGINAFAFAAWDSTNGLYARAGITFNTDILTADDMNASFDARYAAGEVYHIFSHPNVEDWGYNDKIPKHLDYISNKTDVWYVGFGALYAYHFVQARLNGTKYTGLFTVLPEYSLDKSRTDFADIRFTDDDGSTLLDYWLENKTDASSGTFWVEVADSLETDAQTIYIYYGNADVDSLSNAKATSLWGQGDDFSDNAIDTGIWTANTASSQSEESQRLEIRDTTGYAGYRAVSTASFIVCEVFVTAYVNSIDSIGLYLSLTSASGNPVSQANLYRMFLSRWDSKLYIQKRVSSSTTTLYSGAYTASPEKLKIRIEGTTVKFLEQSTQRASEAWSFAVDDVYILLIGYRPLTAGIWGSFNDFFSRKYVSPGPAHGAWGSEEQANEAPNTPSVPSGPSSGFQNTTYTFSSSATDPDGDQVKIKFDYGDGSQWESDFVDSGTPVNHDHSFSSVAAFCVKAMATDEHGAISGWSSCHNVDIVNRVPDAPSTPTGPSSGYHNVSYGFNSSATDPDNNTVRLRFDWGDSTTSDSSFVNSGTNVQLWHTWSSMSTMCVKTRATDIIGGQSGWSSCHYIELGNRAPNTPSTPSGPTSGYSNVTYDFSSSGTDPDNDWVKLNFSWGDGSNTWTDLAPSGTNLQKAHSWANTGSYCVKTMAVDSYGAASGWSSCHDIAIGNQPPNTPSIPGGLTSGYQNTSYTYNSSATDPDNDQVKIKFSYGDGNQWESEFVDSGTNVSHSHSWSTVGTFCIKAMATDISGETSGWSACRNLTIANRPPNTPSVPTGPTSGYQNTSYTFNSSADDPDDNQVKIKFDYGDGSTWESDFVDPGSNISHAHSFASVGSFCVKAKATDALGASSGWSGCLTISITNRPPGNASTPSGPDSGYRKKPYAFNSSATDPDNNKVKIKFDYGDGSTWESGFVDSGAIVSHSHSWSSAGTYCVKAMATDILGATSNWSSCHMITITNRKPNTPSIPTGPSSGYHNVSYAFNSSATDPDDDVIKLTFDWGDGQTNDSEWVDPGANVQMSHAWTGTGTFCVKARATDILGAQSDWSDCPVDIRNRPPNTPSTPTGPTSGYTNTTYAYNSSATDPDNDWVSIKYEWGDGSQSQSAWMPSGTNAQLSHNWTSTGTYCVKTKTTDSYGDTSGWSSCLMMSITYNSSGAPPAPISLPGNLLNTASAAGGSAVSQDSSQGLVIIDLRDGSTWETGFVDSGATSGHDRLSSSAGSLSVSAIGINDFKSISV